MIRVLKTLFLILALPVVQGCHKNDEDVTPPAEEYSYFLNTKQYQFQGKLSDSAILWRYGVNEFQGGNSSFPLGTDDQPQKSLSFDLVSNDNLSTGIEIITPSYNVQSDDLFSKVLAEGDKEIGEKFDKFELSITLDKTRYTTNGDQTNSMLQVLKVEKSTDVSNSEVVLVWFKVECTFYSTLDQSSLLLKDGYLLACFNYNL